MSEDTKATEFTGELWAELSPGIAIGPAVSYRVEQDDGDHMRIAVHGTAKGAGAQKELGRNWGVLQIELHLDEKKGLSLKVHDYRNCETSEDVSYIDGDPQHTISLDVPAPVMRTQEPTP